jgi:L-ascorbate metabolism protein UlaG (beta-lactamase superfamily)
VRKLFSRKAKTPKAKIEKSANGHHAVSEAAGAKKVGLKPKGGWVKRNFLTSVLIPSMFRKRLAREVTPVFPTLRDGDIGVTWIGHASFLLQLGKHNLLVDPNWARWLKVVKRLKMPGLHLHELPDIDLVLVTHAHFDHLDRRTLRNVAANQPIVVPFEVGNLVHDLGFRSVHELGYWETFKLGPLKVTLTPCAHWGARMLHDSHRGFGGFIIEHEGRTIYHCGDTAYFDGFKEIGRRFGVDVALLPIGAYDPPSGREVHMNPDEAIRAFQDLGAKTLVPMHYGTFQLSYEPMDEPLRWLLSSARHAGVSERVAVMLEGRPEVF